MYGGTFWCICKAGYLWGCRVLLTLQPSLLRSFWKNVQIIIWLFLHCICLWEQHIESTLLQFLVCLKTCKFDDLESSCAIYQVCSARPCRQITLDRIAFIVVAHYTRSCFSAHQDATKASKCHGQQMFVWDSRFYKYRSIFFVIHQQLYHPDSVSRHLKMWGSGT